VPTEVRAPKYDQVARVGAEERTYRADQDPQGKQFLRDLLARDMGNSYDARSRLERHMAEEKVERAGQVFERAAGTGAFAGLVVPQYLTDLYAPKARAGRPFADACRHHDMPEDGMTVNLSRPTRARKHIRRVWARTPLLWMNASAPAARSFQASMNCAR
jgi:hypothetical protein